MLFRNILYLEPFQKKTRKSNPMTKVELEKEIEALNAQLTGDMFQDMAIRDKIHNLKMKLNGTKPANSKIDCVGCGS